MAGRPAQVGCGICGALPNRATQSGMTGRREIKPRELHMLSRCPDCKSADTLRPESPPMFHPAHKLGAMHRDLAWWRSVHAVIRSATPRAVAGNGGARTAADSENEGRSPQLEERTLAANLSRWPEAWRQIVSYARRSRAGGRGGQHSSRSVRRQGGGASRRSASQNGRFGASGGG